MFLFSALCYICTMKPPPQALKGPGEEALWHFVLVSVMHVSTRPLPRVEEMACVRAAVNF